MYMPQLIEPKYDIIKTTKQQSDQKKKKFKYLDDIIDKSFVKKYLQTINLK